MLQHTHPPTWPTRSPKALACFATPPGSTHTPQSPFAHLPFEDIQSLGSQCREGHSLTGRLLGHVTQSRRNPAAFAPLASLSSPAPAARNAAAFTPFTIHSSPTLLPLLQGEQKQQGFFSWIVPRGTATERPSLLQLPGLWISSKGKCAIVTGWGTEEAHRALGNPRGRKQSMQYLRKWGCTSACTRPPTVSPPKPLWALPNDLCIRLKNALEKAGMRRTLIMHFS